MLCVTVTDTEMRENCDNKTADPVAADDFIYDLTDSNTTIESSFGSNYWCEMMCVYLMLAK